MLETQPAPSAWQNGARAPAWIASVITFRHLGRFRTRRRQPAEDSTGQLRQFELTGPSQPATNGGAAEPAEPRKRFDALHEYAPVACIAVAETGRIRAVNAAAVQLLGFSQSRLHNLPFTLLLAPADVDAFFAHLERCRQAPGCRIVVELQLQRQNRRVIPVELATIAVERNEQRLFQCVLTDVTERREKEQALEQAKEFAESIVETVEEPLIIVDGHLKVVSANRAFVEAFGRSIRTVRGQLVENLFGMWWSGNELRGQLESVLAGNKLVRNLQVELAQSDTGKRIFLLSARRLYRKQALPPLVLIALQDITELKQAEERLRLTNEQLEQRVQARTRALQESNEQMEAFCYSIAHDLRAPLRAMKGFSQVLIEDFGAEIGREGKECTDRIMAAAERMDDLICDLLDYGRLNTISLATEDTDWESIVGTVIAHLEKEVEDTRAEIVKASSLPRVRGHSLVLQVALTNLVSNALKFVAPGVTPRIRIFAEDKGSVQRLWVQDNGIGIAPEHQKRIFEVFQRLHTVETYPGTGIGLAIVSKGIERIGGCVGVESEPGKGSRFWIDLPTA